MDNGVVAPEENVPFASVSFPEGCGCAIAYVVEDEWAFVVFEVRGLEEGKISALAVKAD